GKVSNADRKEKKKKEERREKTNRGATTDTTDEKPRCHYGLFGRKIKTAKHHEKSRKKRGRQRTRPWTFENIVDPPPSYL
ncbi:hypothetical protein M514_13235, partial [Trichuris suis]